MIPRPVHVYKPQPSPPIPQNMLIPLLHNRLLQVYSQIIQRLEKHKYSYKNLLSLELLHPGTQFTYSL